MTAVRTVSGDEGNRLVNPDEREGGNVPLESIEIPASARKAHLKGHGFMKVFKSVSKNGDVEFHATDDLETEERRSARTLGPGLGASSTTGESSSAAASRGHR